MIYLVSNQNSVYSSELFKTISLEDALDLLIKTPILGLDTETGGLDCFTKKLLLLQLGTYEFQVLFDISSYNGKIPEKLKVFLNTSTALFILQNAKFDLKFLFVQEVILTNVFDTMLAETIITNGLQFKGRDLKSIAMKYLSIELDKTVRGDIITKGLSDRVLLYSADDVKYLELIMDRQITQINSLNLKNAVALDNKFVVVLAYIEYCGIKLDLEAWLKRTTIAEAQVLILKKELENFLWKDKKYKYFSGMTDMYTLEQDCILNWDSPKQVLELFNSYGINTILKKKGEDVSTIDAKVLEPQVNKFPILPPYLKYKEAQKEISTYGRSWSKYINPKTKRIHTTFKQLMVTGRLSCGNKKDGTVNLQNIPSDPETRRCFIPEPGNLMCSCDYSSQESIVLANFSKEPNLINFYEKGLTDSHSYIAFLMYPELKTCDPKDVTSEILDYIKNNHKDKRQNAKKGAFTIAYGGNGNTIAKNCNIPKEDGEFVYNAYFAAFPKMRQYFDFVAYNAAKNGYIEFNKITKRKYFFNQEENDFFALKSIVEDPYFWRTSNAVEINKRYKAAKSELSRVSQNFPIQGSSADITKYACILFFKEVLKRNWFNVVKMVNIVHDEIIIEAPEELIELAKDVLLTSMKTAAIPFCPIVPLGASADIGDHWIH